MAKKYVEIDGVKMEVKKAKKPFYKRIWVWGLGLIIVASIASGGGNDEETNTKATKAQEPKTAAVQKDEVKKEEVKTYGIGQVATVGDVGFTVTNVEETNVIKSNNQFQDDATTDGKFVLVDVKIDNGKQNALSISNSYFEIKVNGAEYRPSTDSDVSMVMSLKNEDSFFLEQINPGLSKSGTVVFELPADADVSQAILQCQTGTFGTETININLK